MTQEAPKTYRVLSRLKHNSKIYAPGLEGRDTVELFDREAQRLLSMGYPVIEPLETPSHTEITLSSPPQVLTVQQEASPEVKTSINTATLDELIEVFGRVNGIGKGSAKAVFENRPYSSLDEVPDKADLVGTARNKWSEVSKFLTV